MATILDRAYAVFIVLFIVVLFVAACNRSVTTTVSGTEVHVTKIPCDVSSSLCILEFNYAGFKYIVLTRYQGGIVVLDKRPVEEEPAK